LSVAVLADWYVISDEPAGKMVTLHQMPVYSVPSMPSDVVVSEIVRPWKEEEWLVIPAPYIVDKPSETSIALPEPLGLVPFLPIQNHVPIEERAIATPVDVIRAQVGVESSREILSTAPPLPRGPVAEGTIDPKFIESPDSSNSDLDALAGRMTSGNPAQSVSPGQAPGTQQSDPLGYSVLVFAAVVATLTLGLIYMAFVAFDYRQRWMQSLTAQNNRYIVDGTFDTDMENTYGSSVSFSDGFGFSESFGLARRSI